MLRDHYLFVILGLLAPVVLSKHVHFYRKDYTYIEEYDAFYKVHWDLDGLTWDLAFRACDDEGARMFFPKGDEWKVIKNLTAAMQIAPNKSEIYVGIHDEFNLGEFITIDGKPTESPLNTKDDMKMNDAGDCMIMDIVTGQFKISECSTPLYDPIRAFVCKKVDDESCPTIDHDYKYVKHLKKCYKVHKKPKFWLKAMQTCYMEGGILAVIENSDVPDWIQEGQEYFIGFKKMFASLDFYTVKGDRFENAYFKNWYDPIDRVDKDCGTMKYYHNQQLKMEVNYCDSSLPFICEMST